MKLQAFEELVDELIGNHHKVLILGQFVVHLEIIRELLDKKAFRVSIWMVQPVRLSAGKP
ncbi:MAG: hypothetical protein LV471_11455 [Nitrosomonas sp.]|nr:hypothetical protein [Nitrosomonas sp.]